MTLRLIWFAGVFGASAWLGAHWDARPAGLRAPDPAAVLPFDPATVITKPLHEITQVLQRR
jgi:hypothetical protein